VIGLRPVPRVEDRFLVGKLRIVDQFAASLGGKDAAKQLTA